MGLEHTDQQLFEIAKAEVDISSIIRLIKELAQNTTVVLLAFDQFRSMFLESTETICAIDNLYIETDCSQYCQNSLTLPQLFETEKTLAIVYLGIQINGFTASPSYTLYEKLKTRIISFHEPIQTSIADSCALHTPKLILPYFKQNRKIKISFIILTGLNNGDSFYKMLNSFKKHTPPNKDTEVITVINGSSDQSITNTYRSLGLGYNLKIIHCPENLGISGGFNEGIDAASGEYICLLQDDIKFSRHGWCNELAYYLDHYPKIGIMGGYRAGYYFKKETSNYLETPYIGVGSAITGRPGWDYLEKHVVEADCANCMAVMFRNTLGKYDEHFLPNGLEDIVFCFEARRSGHEVYVTDVGISHDLESATRSQKRSRLNLFQKKQPPHGNLHKRLSRSYHYKIFQERYNDLLRTIPETMDKRDITLEYLETKIRILPKTWQNTQS